MASWRPKSLILFMSAIITLSECATGVSFLSADQTTTIDGTLFKPDGPGPFPAVVPPRLRWNPPTLRTVGGSHSGHVSRSS